MNLFEEVRQAGVLGAGGAGFPTHVKLSSKADTILLNAAECEPLLRVDQQLMVLYTEEILRGFEMAGRYVGAQRGLIGIKAKHKKVIGQIQEAIDRLKLADYLTVVPMDDVYPAGDEQFLVYTLTGRITPEAGLPIHVGCVVLNSETAFNIYHASLGLPVVDTFLTVAGDVPDRMTLKVPVGTPILEVLKMSGVDNLEDYAVIDGGPMMGNVLRDFSGFVTKKSKGFLLLKKDHPLIIRKTLNPDQTRRINRATCEQCRMCTDICPRYLMGHDLQPHKMMRVVGYRGEACQDQEMAYLCCQCNLCELFACPVGLYPKAANMQVKKQLMDANIKFTSKNKQYETREPREYRLVPSKRLIARLGLMKLDQPAPFLDHAITPAEVRIMTSQHVGAPAEPIVSIGETVCRGQMIGRIPEGSLGIAVHASISGTVVDATPSGITIRRS